MPQDSVWLRGPMERLTPDGKRLSQERSDRSQQNSGGSGGRGGAAGIGLFIVSFCSQDIAGSSRDAVF